jgi:uncharacterized protein
MSTSRTACPFLTAHPQSKCESPQIQNLISTLNLTPNIEGGYFIETDRSPLAIPSPYPYPATSSAPQTRNLSTTILYLLTPHSPICVLHRNKSRAIHSLHHGRGRYVIIHADEATSTSTSTSTLGAKEMARVEVFDVGCDISKGEKRQWVVEGGKWKGSFLLPDDDGEGASKEGLLITETVVPGFEYSDHEFLGRGQLEGLVGGEGARELGWLLRDGGVGGEGEGMVNGVP